MSKFFIETVHRCGIIKHDRSTTDDLDCKWVPGWVIYIEKMSAIGHDGTHQYYDDFEIWGDYPPGFGIESRRLLPGQPNRPDPRTTSLHYLNNQMLVAIGILVNPFPVFLASCPRFFDLKSHSCRDKFRPHGYELVTGTLFVANMKVSCRRRTCLSFSYLSSKHLPFSLTTGSTDTMRIFLFRATSDRSRNKDHCQKTSNQ